MAQFFVRLLSRLSVGRKLMLIYLLDLTAVIFITSILINEKFIAIDFARKEIAGNAYVAGVRDGLIDAALSAAAAPEASGIARRTRPPAQTRGGTTARACKAPRCSAAFAAYHPAGGDRAAASAAAERPALARARWSRPRPAHPRGQPVQPDPRSGPRQLLHHVADRAALPGADRGGDSIGKQLGAGATGLPMGGDARTQYLILEGQLDATAKGIAPTTPRPTPRRRRSRPRSNPRAVAAAAVESFAAPRARWWTARATPARWRRRRPAGRAAPALQSELGAATAAMDALLDRRVDGLFSACGCTWARRCCC